MTCAYDLYVAAIFTALMKVRGEALDKLNEISSYAFGAELTVKAARPDSQTDALPSNSELEMSEAPVPVVDINPLPLSTILAVTGGGTLILFGVVIWVFLGLELLGSEKDSYLTNIGPTVVAALSAVRAVQTQLQKTRTAVNEEINNAAKALQLKSPFSKQANAQTAKIKHGSVKSTLAMV